MIELEILQGLRSKEQDLIQDLLRVLHFIDAPREDFITAGLMLKQLRTKGITIPSSDCLIAAQCIRKNIPLFTLDNDVKQIPTLKKYTS
jgi:predicted nucleic acid-binding protein